jgi:serine/threonine protein kinase
MPWADMDLEDFLAGGYREMQSTTPAPPLDDLIAESRKVASAIHFLHENLQLESEWEEFRHLAICHADLKPRNILVFKCEGSSTGIWRISDFGVSRVARRALSENGRRGSGYTTSLNDHSPKGGAYQAPEARTQRRSDVWSFGCILVRVFALGLDPASLAELDESRRKPLVGRVLDDSFYQKDPPALHPSIESWLQSLPAQYHTSHNLGFLEKMQKLLRSMLQIDYHQRSSAHEVRSDLHALHSSGSSRVSIHSPASTETYQGTDHSIDPLHPSAPVEGVGVLVTVIKSGAVDNVRQALRGNVDVEQCDQGERPLIHAIEVTNPTKIRALSEYQRKFHNRNLNVRAPSSKGKTPLYPAICKGDVDTVEAVIDADIGPDSNADTNTLLNELCDDKTPLMQAAFLGHTAVVSLLLERGADHRICVQQQKLNCLHYAVKFGNHAKENVIMAFKHKMIFDQLPPDTPLDSGGNPTKPVAYVTPMMMHIRLALNGSYTSLEPDSLWGRKFKALLDGGASVKWTYDAGTPLEMSPLEIAVMQNNLLVVKALVCAAATLPVGYSVPHGTSNHIKKLLKDVKREHPVRGH